MADIYVKSGGGTKGSGSYRGNWSASGTWAVGDRVIATNVTSYRVHECTTGGSGDATQPTWNTTTGGTTTMAGGAVFTTRLPSTWANATTGLRNAAANAVSGDTVWVSKDHAEYLVSSGSTFNFASSVGGHIRILCVDDTGSPEPPTALATTATAKTDFSTGLNFSGYIYGVAFDANDFFQINPGNAWSAMLLESCKFRALTSAGNGIRIGGLNGQQVMTLKNPVFRLGSTSQRIIISHKAQIFGGSFETGGSSPTGSALFHGPDASYSSELLVDGLDMSNLSASTIIFAAGQYANYSWTIRNSKLPASWTGSLIWGSFAGPGARVRMHNCDSGATNYRLWEEAYEGWAKSETGIYASAGASFPGPTSGTIRWSIRMAAFGSSIVRYPTYVMVSPEIAAWCDTAGSAVTATIEIAYDGATALKDDEVWVEVQYMGNSGSPLASFIGDGKADVLATGATQASSSATWTGLSGTGPNGSTTWNRAKLAVTFTPQSKGYLQAVVKLAKPSTTIFIDPLITLT